MIIIILLLLFNKNYSGKLFLLNEKIQFNKKIINETIQFNRTYKRYTNFAMEMIKPNNHSIFGKTITVTIYRYT